MSITRPRPTRPLYDRLKRTHLRTSWEASRNDPYEIECDLVGALCTAFDALRVDLSDARTGREAYRVGPFLQIYMDDLSRPMVDYGCNTGFLVPLTKAAELWLVVNAPADPACTLYQDGRPLHAATL